MKGERREKKRTCGRRFAGQYLDLGLQLGDPPLCVFGDGGVGVRQVGAAFVTCLGEGYDGKWGGVRRV